MKVIHIGFPKTATTFLQTVVFPRMATDGLTYVPWEESAKAFASLIDDDDTIYDAAATAERVRALSGAGDALFSYEVLTGYHYRSGFVNRSQIARRLRDAGFDRVLITIRNQFDALESTYKQYVKSGGVLRFREYVSFDAEKPPYLHPRYFDYFLVYERYGSLFGRDNVLVLQYERLHRPEAMARLAAFLGVRPVEVEWSRNANRSLSYGKTAVLRLFNHVTYSSYRPSSLLSRRISTAAAHRLLRSLPFGDGDRSFLDEETRASIASFYADSNRKLADAVGLELDAAYP